MPANPSTIAQYISRYSPRYKPVVSMGKDEYLERALSMLDDCYNLALWEQNDRRLVRGLKHLFPWFTGYSKLRYTVQTTKGATAASAINAISAEIGALVGLREPAYLTSALHAMRNALHRCEDVKLLDIPRRLAAMHELFRTSPNFTLKPPVTKNEILADLPFVEAPDKNYTYLKSVHAPILDLDGVGILGEQPESPKKWQAEAYTGFNDDALVESFVHDCASKKEAMEWGKKTLSQGSPSPGAFIVPTPNGDIFMYPLQKVVFVHVREITNV